MLLIDLDKWRKKNITPKMINFLDANFDKLKMLDQDLINIFFQDDLTLIDSRWNHILFHGSEDPYVKSRTGIFHLL
jgi:lipopolysaccharide biosynthesis glycosyltransferase